jgi:hypothetical protein
MNIVLTATTHPGFILSTIDRLGRFCSDPTGVHDPWKGTPTIARQRGGGRALDHLSATLTAPISP